MSRRFTAAYWPRPAKIVVALIMTPLVPVCGIIYGVAEALLETWGMWRDIWYAASRPRLAKPAPSTTTKEGE